MRNDMSESWGKDLFLINTACCRICMVVADIHPKRNEARRWMHDEGGSSIQNVGNNDVQPGYIPALPTPLVPLAPLT